MLAPPKFALLTTIDHPLLPGYAAELRDLGITDYAIICDKQGIGSSSARLILDRVGGWNLANHYDLCIDKDLPETPFYFVENHNCVECERLILKLEIDLLVNAGTPRRIASNILASARSGVLNIHPGELPHYRGKNCPEWAIHNNDQVILSAHFMTEHYDEGAVLAVKSLEPRIFASYEDFRKAIYMNTFELTAATTKRIINGNAAALFDSRQLPSKYPVQEAMPPEILNNVRNFFLNT
jgi:hypothetical protein